MPRPGTAMQILTSSSQYPSRHSLVTPQVSPSGIFGWQVRVVSSTAKHPGPVSHEPLRPQSAPSGSGAKASPGTQVSESFEHWLPLPQAATPTPHASPSLAVGTHEPQ